MFSRDPVIVCIGACLALEIMLRNKVMEDGDAGLICCWFLLLAATVGAIAWWFMLQAGPPPSSGFIAHLPLMLISGYLGWAWYRMIRASWPHR